MCGENEFFIPSTLYPQGHSFISQSPTERLIHCKCSPTVYKHPFITLDHYNNKVSRL